MKQKKHENSFALEKRALKLKVLAENPWIDAMGVLVRIQSDQITYNNIHFQK